MRYRHVRRLIIFSAKKQERPRLPNHSGHARAYSVTCVLAVMAAIEGNGKR